MSEGPEPRRQIPSVSALLSLPEMARLSEHWGHALVVQAARQAAEGARQALQRGQRPPEDWGAAVAAAIERLTSPSLVPAINASGIVVHTNLGRAPLPENAIQAIARVAAGYSNLEYDLGAGERGSRYVHAEEALRELTGAEAAIVVNNNAAAVLLVLSALAYRREVVISRGQLVEIGGGFRIPEVMAQSGAALVEVGTTNRTYVEDYVRALSPETALLLVVHRSNFYIGGFVHEPTLTELAGAAHAAGLPLYADLGSGALRDTAPFGLEHEPTVQECLQAGADVVSFSGDKLLGGPQAGIIAGKGELIERMRRHPLMRALRVGKLTLAALEATLLHYRRGDDAEAIPVWRMLALSVEAVESRARAWHEALGEGELRSATSAVGGGSLPGQTLPTIALALPVARPQVLAADLRRTIPPVVARVQDDAVLLDPRTVMPQEDDALLEAIRSALAAYRSGDQTE